MIRKYGESFIETTSQEVEKCSSPDIPSALLWESSQHLFASVKICYLFHYRAYRTSVHSNAPVFRTAWQCCTFKHQHEWIWHLWYLTRSVKIHEQGELVVRYWNLRVLSSLAEPLFSQLPGVSKLSFWRG